MSNGRYILQSIEAIYLNMLTLSTTLVWKWDWGTMQYVQNLTSKRRFAFNFKAIIFFRVSVMHQSESENERSINFAVASDRNLGYSAAIHESQKRHKR